MSYSPIPDIAVAVGAPVSTGLLTANRDNPLAIARQNGLAPDSRGTLLFSFSTVGGQAPEVGPYPGSATSLGYLVDARNRNTVGQFGQLFQADFSWYTVAYFQALASGATTDDIETIFNTALLYADDSLLTIGNDEISENANNPGAMLVRGLNVGALGDTTRFATSGILTVGRPTDTGRKILGSRSYYHDIGSGDPDAFSVATTTGFSEGPLSGIQLLAYAGETGDPMRPLGQYEFRVYGHR